MDALLILDGQREALELFFLFGKGDSDSSPLMFSALDIDFSVVQAYQDKRKR